MALDYNELNKIRKSLMDKLNLPDDHPDSIVSYRKELDRKKLIRTRWEQKISNYFESAEDKVALIEKLLAYNHKESNRLFTKGIDGESNLIGLTYNALKPFGKPFEDEDYDMFVVDGFKYMGYDFKIISGQGTFTIISKIEQYGI